jgi:mono/diheme cytochrome c family protein
VRRIATRRLLCALGVAAAVALAAGCGAGGVAAENPDLEAGQQSFVTSCGACHTLADAGTAGIIGPDLDDAFRGARQQGFQDSTFEGVVQTWIEQPQPPMLPDIVTGADAENVAAYVASVAGTSPDSEVRPPVPFVTRPPVPGGKPVEEAPPELQEGETVAGDSQTPAEGGEGE